YAGRYDGPADLRGFRGVVHLPYAWSTLAFFESVQQGLPYFVPSRRFLAALMRERYWFQDREHLDALELCESYAPAHASVITYFDSFDDLAAQIRHADLTAL